MLRDWKESEVTQALFQVLNARREEAKEYIIQGGVFSEEDVLGAIRRINGAIEIIDDIVTMDVFDELIDKDKEVKE